MEHKIGEILKYLDDWYQCVERPSDYKGCACDICSLNMIGCYGVQGCDGSFRADKKSVAFKKLEKIGEPFMYEKRTCQTYQLYTPTDLKMQPDEVQAISVNRGNYTADIEIKQNERNKSMEEKLKEYFETATEEQLKNDFEVLKRFNEPDIPVQEFIESQMSHHLKPFDLEAAKAGKSVCTRDGRKARIICFDKKKKDFPIVALIEGSDGQEYVGSRTKDGRIAVKGESNGDLMMLPEKKEGWVAVYPKGYLGDRAYQSKEDAINTATDDVVDITKITWEE